MRFVGDKIRSRTQVPRRIATDEIMQMEQACT
jgi:hypothetical protein